MPSAGGSPPLALSTGAMQAILGEERRSIAERQATVQTAFGEGAGLLSWREAWLGCLATHVQAVAEQYAQSVDYIEKLLRTQLVAAIGRELTPADFRGYMRHHAHKLLLPSYAPQPFCFAVRQPGRSPEGTVAIELPSDHGVDTSVPIETIVRAME